MLRFATPETQQQTTVKWKWTVSGTFLTLRSVGEINPYISCQSQVLRFLLTSNFISDPKELST